MKEVQHSCIYLLQMQSPQRTERLILFTLCRIQSGSLESILACPSLRIHRSPKLGRRRPCRFTGDVWVAIVEDRLAHILYEEDVTGSGDCLWIIVAGSEVSPGASGCSTSGTFQVIILPSSRTMPSLREFKARLRLGLPVVPSITQTHRS